MERPGARRTRLDSAADPAQTRLIDVQRIDVTEALKPLVEALARDGAAVLVRAGAPEIEVHATVDARPCRQARVHGTEGGGPFAEHFRYSDMFARRNGRWIAVFTQVTGLPL